MSLEVLSEAQLERMKNYRYVSTCNSILDPIMQRFWNRLVEYVPRTLAPNLITAFNFFLFNVSSLLVHFYSLDGKNEIPSAVVFSLIILHFLYQTLDALDGKQARRTQSSSVIGELVDHACDLYCNVLGSIQIASVIQMGLEPETMLAFGLAGMFIFHLSHVQAYITGKMKFGLFDATEMQFGIMAAYLLTGILGPEIWSEKISIPYVGTMTIRKLGTGIAVGWIMNAARFFLLEIYENRKLSWLPDRKSFLIAFIPATLHLCCPLFIYNFYPTPMLWDNLPLFLYTYGMVQLKYLFKFTIGHMSFTPITFLDITLIIWFLPLLNLVFDMPFYFYDEVKLYTGLALFGTLECYRYFITAIHQMSHYFNIDLFTVRLPENRNYNNTYCNFRPGFLNGTKPKKS